MKLYLLSCILLIFIPKEGESGGEASNGGNNGWRSGSDLSQIYESVTPNPTGSLSGPYFLQDDSPTVIGIKGKTTYLVCSIRNLANYTVSWVRHSDTHPLTIGRYTYTPDTRFSSVHKPSSENWVLEIRNTKLSDEGTYECQISTSPVRSLQYTLKISDSLTEILGSKERHVDRGSPFNLTCQVSSYPLAISYILWYLDSQQISEKSADYVLSDIESTGTGEYSRNLSVQSAHKRHSGNYHCTSPAGESHAVIVHVHYEENAAELYLNAAGRVRGGSNQFAALALLFAVSSVSLVC